MIGKFRGLSERLAQQLYEDAARDAAWQALIGAYHDPDQPAELEPTDPIARRLSVSTGGLAVFASKLGSAPDRFMRSILPQPKIITYRRGNKVFQDVQPQFLIKSRDVADFLNGPKPILDPDPADTLWQLSSEAASEICVTDKERQLYAPDLFYGHQFLTGVLQKIGRLSRPLPIDSDAIWQRGFLNEPFESDRWALGRLAQQGREKQPLVSDLACRWAVSLQNGAQPATGEDRLDTLLFHMPGVAAEQEELICAGVGLAHAHAEAALRTRAEQSRFLHLDR